MLDLPANLISSVRDQNAVLFLGAGASYGANHPASKKVPSGDALRDMLSDRFLNGALKDRSLAAVAEYAANETSLLTVQEFVRDLFEPYQPAAFHKLLPTFRWWAIATTNYDRTIERGYEQTRNGMQNLVKRFKDGDGFDSRLRKEAAPLEYIKLHGCIEHYTDMSIPLILGQEQYARYLKNRTRLFDRLRDLAHEHPLIFCGYRIEDSHIQQLLFDLTDTNVSRPMYYYVSPDISEFEIRYWAKHRIIAIKATFEELLSSLDGTIPHTSRALKSDTGGGDLSIRKHYRIAGATESDELKAFLEKDVLHIRDSMTITHQNPADFYKGYDRGWGAIAQELDVRRNINDSVLVDAILAGSDTQKPVELSILLGPAGNGKTVSLKRIAWEAAHAYDQLVLFLHDTGSIKVTVLQEIAQLTGKRILLFIDRLSTKRSELQQSLQSLKQSDVKISIIGTDRANEWETISTQIAEFVKQEFEVRYLSETEVNSLLDLLSKHNALGLLSGVSRQQQIDAFVKRAQRQLLVALHEATLGLPFETILKDEYDSIPTVEARQLYLSICSLNQFGAPVRAGLIYRAIGIEFADFKDKLIAPLRDIVFAEIDRYTKDFYYRARHQHVAEIVFNQVLSDQNHRYDVIVSLLRAMNPEYTSDADTFASIIRGRNVAQMFASVELGRLLYDAAHDVSPNESHVLHQRAIFEMRHQGGSLDLADRYAAEAAELNRNPSNFSINHTRADIARRKAEKSNDPILKEALRRDARSRLATASNDEYYLHTKALLAIDELKELLEEAEERPSKSVDRQIVESVREAELAIQNGQQISPESTEMLTAEAKLRECLKQHKQADAALEKAFELNRRQDWLAVQLARRYSANDENETRARQVLSLCLMENPGSKTAHLAYAKSLMKSAPSDPAIIDHLKSSFSAGDTNFEAQFWYARELFLRGSAKISQALFAQIDQRAPSGFRKMPAAEALDDGGSIARLRGHVSRKEEGYAFLKLVSFDFDVFASRGDSTPVEWARCAAFSHVSTVLQFTRRGPRATGIQIEK